MLGERSFQVASLSSVSQSTVMGSGWSLRPVCPGVAAAPRLWQPPGTRASLILQTLMDKTVTGILGAGGGRNGPSGGRPRWPLGAPPPHHAPAWLPFSGTSHNILYPSHKFNMLYA